MKRFTTIPIFAETRERLKLIGRKGETYDALLNRILDEKERSTFEFEAEVISPTPSQTKAAAFKRMQKFEKTGR